MDPYGKLFSEPIFDKKGKVSFNSQSYDRSLPLDSIKLVVPVDSRVTWRARANVISGFLEFLPDDEIIKVSRVQDGPFDAWSLMDVNHDEDGDTEERRQNPFPPMLHKMLNDKTDWECDLRLRGLADFSHGILEWTEVILRDFKDVLLKADILGAVAVSRYPFDYSPEVWKAFVELWSPLTNTLHHGGGEMGISLYDMKMIGGLPVLGVPYEEFIPPNKDIGRYGKYSATFGELLNIHSQLCSLYNYHVVFCDQWLAHFYRDKIIYGGYGESRGQRFSKPRKSVSTKKIPLVISKEGRLAAFLVYFLSRFAFPSQGLRIRPETFHMASLMARGVKVSLAPAVLGYICHGLRQFVDFGTKVQMSSAVFPAHYVVGWLGEYFPCLHKSHADNVFPKGYPRLARYAGTQANNVDLSHARAIFRSDRSVHYRPNAFPLGKSRDFVDDDKLPDDQFEMLICTRMSKLPVRVGGNLCVEPYYPNRFGRQFGFDQGIPSNHLDSGVSRRSQCTVECLFKAQIELTRRNTGALFYIPRSTRAGRLSYWYCRWWMAFTASYLGRSVASIGGDPSHRPLGRRSFVISDLREVSANLKKAIPLPDTLVKKLPPASRLQSRGGTSGKRGNEHAGERVLVQRSSSSGSSRDINFKRARYGQRADSGNSAVAKSVGKDASVSADKSASAEKFVPLDVDIPPEEIVPLATSPMADAVYPAVDDTSPSLIEDFLPLFDARKSILDIFCSGAANPRHGFIIGEVQSIFDRLSAPNLFQEVPNLQADVALVFNVLRPMLGILDSGKAELEWFMSTVNDVLMFASQVSEVAEAVEQGSRIRALVDRHKECLSAKKALGSELSVSVRELAVVDAEESIVKEAEERARLLREQHDAKKLLLVCRVDKLKSSMKEQEDLEKEICQSKIDAKEDMLPDFERAETMSESAREEIQKLLLSLSSFCRKS